MSISLHLFEQQSEIVGMVLCYAWHFDAVVFHLNIAVQCHYDVILYGRNACAPAVDLEVVGDTCHTPLRCVCIFVFVRHMERIVGHSFYSIGPFGQYIFYKVHGSSCSFICETMYDITIWSRGYRRFHSW